MADNENLNPDAIYAAMAFLREYAGSPEGQAAYRELLEQKAEKVGVLRSMSKGTGAVVHIRPVFDITDELIEEIYPGEPDSVKAGIELGRTVIWGPPGAAAAYLEMLPGHEPAGIALSRFVADWAN